MNKDKSVELIIENIKNIEEQIFFFQNRRFLFWKMKKNNDYIKRIKSLENVKEYLYKRLEDKLDNG